MELTKYRNLVFEVREVKQKIIDHRKRFQSKEQFSSKAIIVLKNKDNRRKVPHPLTHFVNFKWGALDYSSQYKHAQQICAFLNHVFFEQGIWDLQYLKVEHGVNFLNFKSSNGVATQDLRVYDSTLMKLYKWLSDTIGLKYIVPSEFKMEIVRTPNGNDVERLASFLWKQVRTPNRRRKKTSNMHNMKEELIMPFIECAYDVAPDVVLAIYICMLGGLRASEVCSVRRSSIVSHGVFGEFGLTIDIKQHEFFAKGNQNRVKTERRQNIISVGRSLAVLYSEHLKRYPVPKGDFDALFVNEYGRPMQYQTFLSRFKRVKETFIQRLENSPNPNHRFDAIWLSGWDWATHLCRGVFSNLIAKHADNILQVALERGDLTLDAALSYMESTESIRQAIGNELTELFEGE